MWPHYFSNPVSDCWAIMLWPTTARALQWWDLVNDKSAHGLVLRVVGLSGCSRFRMRRGWCTGEGLPILQLTQCKLVIAHRLPKADVFW